jgi:hypothetical protein
MNLYEAIKSNLDSFDCSYLGFYNDLVKAIYANNGYIHFSAREITEDELDALKNIILSKGGEDVGDNKFSVDGIIFELSPRTGLTMTFDDSKGYDVVPMSESDSVDALKSKLVKLADDHFLHNMDDHWGDEGFKRDDSYTKDISEVIDSLEKQGVAVYHKDSKGNEVPGYAMGYEVIFKDKIDEAERVSEIDLKRISLEDREYDLDFEDKLEELGYEYIFKYDGKVFYHRDPNHFDDDIIIIDTEHGVMTKIDHNGESLFFGDDELVKLNQEEM